MLIVGIALLFGLALMAPLLGRVPAVVLGVLVSVTLFVAPVYEFGENYSHIGIADGVPVLYTGSVVVVVFGLLAFVLRRGRMSVSHALFLVGLALVVVPSLGTSHIAAGALHLSVGVVAFSLGDACARHWSAAPATDERFVTAGVLVVVLVELAVQVLQARGVTFSVLGRDIVPLAQHDRLPGTYVHPAELGKILVLVLPLVLPATRSPLPRVRAVGWLTVVASGASIALTQSRANTIAFALALVIWLLFVPRLHSIGTRVRGVIAMGLVSLPLVAPILSRFGDDPDGGDRPELLQAGIDQIGLSPVFGTLPNNYVEVVGVWDPVTALTGYPVHNAFLLLIAELGIPLAFLFLGPIVGGFAWIAARWVRGRILTPAGGAYLAIIPGVLLIMGTGWGSVNRSLLIASMFFLSFAATRARVEEIAADGAKVLAVQAQSRSGRSRRALGQRSRYRRSPTTTRPGV